jgi:RimJ/RimL family protein N-acetyltransferase
VPNAIAELFSRALPDDTGNLAGLGGRTASGMLTFEPLTGRDLPMVHAWLQRPHVAEWWREPTTLAELERDYVPGTTTGSSTRAYIAILDGEPVGFIQSYVAMGSGEGWWEQETDPGTRGIDQFLANAEQLGRGIGSAMVRLFVERLFEDPAVTKVQADPSPENQRAIRCYRRAGFVVHGEVATPDGPALLMLRYRENHASPLQRAL